MRSPSPCVSEAFEPVKPSDDFFILRSRLGFPARHSRFPLPPSPHPGLHSHFQVLLFPLPACSFPLSVPSLDPCQTWLPTSCSHQRSLEPLSFTSFLGLLLPRAGSPCCSHIVPLVVLVGVGRGNVASPHLPSLLRNICRPYWRVGERPFGTYLSQLPSTPFERKNQAP